jgi:hypothetical protein
MHRILCSSDSQVKSQRYKTSHTGFDDVVHVPLRNWVEVHCAVQLIQTGLDVGVHVPVRYWKLEQSPAVVHGLQTRSDDAVGATAS